jgi:hypothetical protein
MKGGLTVLEAPPGPVATGSTFGEKPMQQEILTPSGWTVAGGRTDADYIVIEVRSVYGEMKAYPACPRARIFADIAGTITLTRATLNLVEQLGVTIVSRANADWHAVR